MLLNWKLRVMTAPALDFRTPIGVENCSQGLSEATSLDRDVIG